MKKPRSDKGRKSDRAEHRRTRGALRKKIAAWRTVCCPTCAVPAHIGCVRLDSIHLYPTSHPHVARIAAGKHDKRRAKVPGTSNELLAVPCPFCAATAGKPCRSRYGGRVGSKNNGAHMQRIRESWRNARAK